MKTANQRVFAFTLLEASEAFADYIKKTTGESFGKVAGVNINVDPQQGLIIWTVTKLEQQAVPDPDAPPPIPFPSGGLSGQGNLH